MTIDKLVEASTILFPRVITLKGARQLLDYLSENLPADIHAKIEYFENRYNVLGREEGEPMGRFRGTITISGSIKTKSFVFDSFITEPARRTSRIKAIRFQIIPGYDLEEHSPEVRQLWQDVRTQVENYFKSTTG